MGFKKISTFNGIILALFSIFSCSKNNDFLASNDIFISEYFVGSFFKNSAIEIVNNTNKDIDCSKYHLDIFNMDELSKNIELNTVLKANSSIVLLNKTFDSTLLVNDNLNLIYLDDDYLTGDRYIELRNDKNKLLDCMGIKGYNLSYVSATSLIKLEKYFSGHSNFSKTYFVEISKDNTKYLGNTLFPLTYEELMYGPRLSSSYYSPSLSREDGSPTGGYSEVNIISLGDGDTTVFSFDNDKDLQRESVRYLLINTPEIAHSSNEEDEFMGRQAKIYNNNILNNAKHILVQTNKDYALRETYGRILGYVWYTNVENPTLNDYRMLNYELLVNGYCRYDSRTKYENMSYLDMYYTNYFDYAYEYASNLRLGVFSK